MKTVRKRLGELVIRTSNVSEMTDFYCDVIGLEMYAQLRGSNFLKVSDDLEGHPQLLAIFDKSWEFSGPDNLDPTTAAANKGTLHHFAFALEQNAFNQEQRRLEALGIEMHTTTHAMFGWHSIYLHDPDGNSVEFVCYDATALDEVANRDVRIK